MAANGPFRGVRGVVFDLDGTLYLGERLLPGAAEVVAAARERGLAVRFVSNKPWQPGRVYAEKLTRLGVPASAEDVLTSGGVTAAALSRSNPGARVMTLGERPLVEELRAAGLDAREEDPAAEVVVASFDRQLVYRRLHAAHQALVRGARFVATNPDATCPIEDDELPDTAGIIAYLEATTGRRCEEVFGKPSPAMIRAIAESLGLGVAEMLVVGDRLETDMRMGIEAGARTALVLTGVTSEADLGASALSPDLVLAGVTELAGQLP
jgi:NagD protein